MIEGCGYQQLAKSRSGCSVPVPTYTRNCHHIDTGQKAQHAKKRSRVASKERSSHGTERTSAKGRIFAGEGLALYTLDTLW